MSLSDCDKCWSTPCCCGWEYLKWTENRLKEFIKTLNGVLKVKKKNPSDSYPELFQKMNELLKGK